MRTAILEYQQRVFTWAAGRTFLYLSSLNIENGPACDACGSKRVKVFRLLEDKNGHYLIGGDCFNLLYNKDQITTDARMNWKGTAFWRDIEVIEKKVLEERCELAKEERAYL